MSELPRSIITELERPFAPNALRYKIQAQWPKTPKHGLVVPYVDARTVAARLNHVVGGDWSTEPLPWGDPSNASLVVCKLTVMGVTRADVGKGGGFEKEKASFSDSLKRAAVLFGCGAYLYSLSSVTLSTDSSDDRPTLRSKTSGNKTTLELTPACVDWLRDGYERWTASGRNRWGKPLDHGDEPDAIGDPAERPLPDAEQPDLETEAKREEVERKIKDLNGSLPKGRGKGYLRAKLKAASSASELDDLASEIEELANA